jgi:hypothetical protein
MARAQRSWGYDRIVGALANLEHTVSDQTAGNIRKRHGIPPSPERQTTTTWKEFTRTHLEVLVATDCFTAEVWTLGGLVTYYVLSCIHLGSRQVHVAAAPVWGSLPTACTPQTCGALSAGTQSSGQGECVALAVSNQRNKGDGPIQDRARLGGLLKYYERGVARVF